MFALYEEAVAAAKSKAGTLANGELDGLTLRAVDARIYIHCAEMAKVTGLLAVLMWPRRSLSCTVETAERVRSLVSQGWLVDQVNAAATLNSAVACW